MPRIEDGISNDFRDRLSNGQRRYRNGLADRLHELARGRKALSQGRPMSVDLFTSLDPGKRSRDSDRGKIHIPRVPRHPWKLSLTPSGASHFLIWGPKRGQARAASSTPSTLRSLRAMVAPLWRGEGSARSQRF